MPAGSSRCVWLFPLILKFEWLTGQKNNNYLSITDEARWLLPLSLTFNKLHVWLWVWNSLHDCLVLKVFKQTQPATSTQVGPLHGSKSTSVYIITCDTKTIFDETLECHIWPVSVTFCTHCRYHFVTFALSDWVIQSTAHGRTLILQVSAVAHRASTYADNTFYI